VEEATGAEQVQDVTTLPPCPPAAASLAHPKARSVAKGVQVGYETHPVVESTVTATLGRQ
jgi:hypothetical protein